MRHVPPLCCIYAIVSPSGRVYIGQTRNVNQRWRHHRNDRRSSGPLQRSFVKYGFHAHVFCVLMVFGADESQSVLNDAERTCLSAYSRQGIPILNLTEGGDNARPSEEHKEKIRRAIMGLKRSEETKRKISIAKKENVHHSAEHNRLVSEKMKGRPATWLKGKKLSPEHVEKIRLASTGRKHTAEFKAQASERNRRNYHLLHSVEARRKRGEKRRGLKLPPEQREKMRLAQLRRWERWREDRAA